MDFSDTVLLGFISAGICCLLLIWLGVRSPNPPRLSDQESIQIWNRLVTTGRVTREITPDTPVRWRLAKRGDRNLRKLVNAGELQVSENDGISYYEPSLKLTDYEAYLDKEAKERTQRANPIRISGMVNRNIIQWVSPDSVRFVGTDAQFREDMVDVIRFGLLKSQSGGTYKVNYEATRPRSRRPTIRTETISPPQPSAASQSNYREYLNSAGWKSRRQEALKRAGHRCQVCNSPSRLEVHHRTYQNLGHEQREDLTVLCAPCHRRFHQDGRMPSR